MKLFHRNRLMEEDFTHKMQSFKVDKKVALAVSGGVDSLALLLLTCAWAKENECEVAVLTVNHNLRPEAELECEYVNSLAKKLKLRCEILKWQNPIPKQNKARIARYQLLTEWCQKNQIKQLLLAHHKNDQAENVLIRLARGSGIDGLCEMKEISCNNDIKLIRPLLQFRKKQLTEYVNSHNVKWVDDPSNEDQKYTRTIFRNYIASSSDPERLVSRLSLTASHLSRVKQAINFYVKQAIENCVIKNKLGYVDLNLEKFLHLPEEVATRVLLTCLMVIGNKNYKPRYKNFNNLFCLIWNKEFHHAQTLHGCKIIQVSDKLLSVRREINNISQKEILTNPGQITIWDNRFRCKADYNGTICKNEKGSELSKSLPVLKCDNEYINPFEDKNCDFQFIFSELALDVLA